MDWLNAPRLQTALLTYAAGLTLYGTLEGLGYGYDTAGVAFGKWYDKGVFYTQHPKTSVGSSLVLGRPTR